MTKFEFMQDMLTRACTRHRQQMGLEPVSAAQMMSDWFGKDCEFQCCTWEDNEATGGPEYKEAYPALIFCSHPTNPDDYEGNCTEKLCPLSE